MNMEVLHRKVLGVPVWGVGIGGAAAVVIFRHFHSSGVGGAQADTTAATGVGDASYGDPVPADSGTFPQTFPSGNGSTPASDSGGGDSSGAIAAGFASLGDLFASAPPPVDYSAQLADLSTAVGNLADQQATTHAAQDEGAAAKHTAAAKKVAPKAAAVHAAARGGHATKPPPKKAPAPKKAPTHKTPAPVHPKAPAAKKPPTPPKKAPAKSAAHRALK